MDTHFSGHMMQGQTARGQIQEQTADRQGGERRIQDLVANR